MLRFRWHYVLQTRTPLCSYANIGACFHDHSSWRVILNAFVMKLSCLLYSIRFFRFVLELCWVFNFNIHLSKGFKPIATVQRTAGDVFPVLRALRCVQHEEPALRHKDLAAAHGYQQLPHQALTSCLQREKNRIWVRINKKIQKTTMVHVNKLVLGLTAWRLDGLTDPNSFNLLSLDAWKQPALPKTFHGKVGLHRWDCQALWEDG